jgi:hypothetical protein
VDGLGDACDFDVELVTTLGIEAVDVSAQLLLEIEGLPHRLSRQDRLVYLACRESDWICLANDRHLRGLCEESEVRLCWGLELMVVGVLGNSLSYGSAIETRP